VFVLPEMLLTHQDNGVSMCRSLKEVSTLNKLLHFGRPNRQTKLVLCLEVKKKQDGHVPVSNSDRK
jgi:hypothetical protein